MKNLLLIFIMLFAVDSIAQLNQREKGDVVAPALNKNPNFIQKTGWTIEAIDPINDTLCSVTPSSDNLTILTANECNARVYQDINSADIRKARFDKETMTAFLKLQSLTYVKITLNVYKKAATTGTLTLLRTRSLENDSNVPLQDEKIVFDVVTADLNFVTDAELADSLRIEFTFEPTVVFPTGVAKVEVNDFRVFSSLTNYSSTNYSPLIHGVKEGSEWTEWQPITITSTDSPNPTKGAITTDACRKKRNGTQLEIDFVYYQISGGNVGNGLYSFSCGNMEYNGEILNVDYDEVSNSVNIGSGSASSPSRLVEARWNVTTDSIMLINNDGASISSDTSPLLGEMYYRFNVSIPIKEWKQSTVDLLTQADYGRISEIIFTSQEYAPNNFIPANNKSIGNTGSTADYKGSYYRELYNILWNQAGTVDTAGHPYRISSAKGASAEADWNANKIINIDYSTNKPFVRPRGGEPLGSYQSDSTKLPNTPFITNSAGAHTHLLTVYRSGNNNNNNLNSPTGGSNNTGVIQNLTGTPTTSAGAHTHTITGGDVETTPKHVNLNVYIRYRDTMINASLRESNITKDVERVRVIATSTTTQTVPALTDTVSVFPDVVIDTHGAYNNTTGEFTAPKDGLYYYSCTRAASPNATLRMMYFQRTISKGSYVNFMTISGMVRRTQGQKINCILQNDTSMVWGDSWASGNSFEIMEMF